MLRTHLAKQNEHRLEIGKFWNDLDFVFTGETGQMRDLDRTSSQFKRVAVKTGYPRARMHDLRHFFGSRLIAKGASINNVSELMGHSSPAITLALYIHASAGDLRTDIQRLAGLFE